MRYFKFGFCLLFFYNTILLTGFLPGTLVSVPSGYIPIEQIKEGDPVIGFNSNGTRTCGSARYISEGFSQWVVEITVEHEVIVVTPDQLFCSLAPAWVKACDLKPGEAVLGLGGPVVIDDVKVVDVGTKVSTFVRKDKNGALYSVKATYYEQGMYMNPRPNGIFALEVHKMQMFTLGMDDQIGVFFISTHDIAVYNFTWQKVRRPVERVGCAVGRAVGSLAKTALYIGEAILIQRAVDKYMWHPFSTPTPPPSSPFDRIQPIQPPLPPNQIPHQLPK